MYKRKKEGNVKKQTNKKNTKGKKEALQKVILGNTLIKDKL